MAVGRTSVWRRIRRTSRTCIRGRKRRNNITISLDVSSSPRDERRSRVRRVSVGYYGSDAAVCVFPAGRTHALISRHLASREAVRLRARARAVWRARYTRTRGYTSGIISHRYYYYYYYLSSSSSPSEQNFSIS